MSTTPFLVAQNLSHYSSPASEKSMILRGVHGEFHTGFSYGLTGSSGSGKTTLLSIFAGIEAPTFGKVLLQGIDLYESAVTAPTRLRKQLGIIFQVPYLIDELTLLENVMIQGLIEQQSYDHALEKARYLLIQVGLTGKELQRPRSLSGGEQQRVCIARALFSEPMFILADEPTAHLDESSAQACMSLLRSYQHEKGAGLLIATHDTTILEKLDYTLHLEKGQLSLESSFSSAIATLPTEQVLHG